MKRWFLRIALFGLLVGVASNFALPTQEMKSLPATAGGWRLLDQSVLQPVPAELLYFRGSPNARRAWRGTYAGDFPVTLTVYDTPTGGFDIIQKWRVVEGMVAFAWGRNIGVAESPGASKEDLRRFILAVNPQAPLELMR